MTVTDQDMASPCRFPRSSLFPSERSFGLCARKAGVGIQDYLRDLIARDLGLEQISASLPPHAKAVVSVPELPPAVEPAPVESILSLIERGFTAQQIAAMRRMPYRQVLAELGKQVDIKTAGGTLECDGARALSDKGA